MANLSGFDARTVEPNQAFEAIPAGDYPAVIVDSKMKPTKDGNGQYLELQLQILNGPFQNRKLFDRLNLVNASDKAVQIAKGTLSAICRAVNVLTPNDSAELHNKPLTVKVKVGKDNNGNPNNEVKGYEPRHTQAAAKPVEKSLVEQSFEPEPAGAVDQNKSPWG